MDPRSNLALALALALPLPRPHLAHLGKHVEGGDGVLELTAAVVGDPHALEAGLHRALGVESWLGLGLGLGCGCGLGCASGLGLGCG